MIRFSADMGISVCLAQFVYMGKLYQNTFLRISLILIGWLFASYSQAQPDLNWTLQAEKDGVRLYSATAPCADKNMLVFRFENTNATLVHVNYNVIIQSLGRNVPLLPQSLELGAAETKTGDCDSGKELIADLKGNDDYQLKVVMVIN